MNTHALIAYSGRGVAPRYYANDHSRDVLEIVPVEIASDAIFDSPGRPERSFEGLVFAHGPGHRWHWFPNMSREEALVFKTHDSDRRHAHCVPHVAFDNPSCPADTPPRVSIEMRALALWLN